MNKTAVLDRDVLVEPVAQQLELLHPLSAAQRGIWFAQQLNPASPLYNIANYLEIHGPVDLDLFETALRQVVGEAEAFHIRFVDNGSGPQQFFSFPGHWPFWILDVSAETDPQAAAEAWMQADLARSTDLTRDPLFAFALFRIAPDRFFLYERVHHIILDGFGASLFELRLADVYSALAAGRGPSASPFGNVRELAAAETAYLTSDVFLRDRRHWMERFDDTPDPTSLAGRRVPAAGILRRRTHLQPEISAALRELARTTGTTLPQLLITLVGIYLRRMTGQTDLVVGLPVTARVTRSLRRIPGMVSNVVPLRLSFAPQATLDVLLQQVGREIRQSLRHQQYRYGYMRKRGWHGSRWCM